MVETKEIEEVAAPGKKTRKVNPGGKKRGPKPKAVNRDIRVRVMDEHTNPLPPAEDGLAYTVETIYYNGETGEKCEKDSDCHVAVKHVYRDKKTGRVLSPMEYSEYVEVTIMPDPEAGKEVPFNDGAHNPMTVIRGHKVIIPIAYKNVMDTNNNQEILRHEPLKDGDFSPYYAKLMGYNYQLHRSGLTYTDFKDQIERFKKLHDPWDKKSNLMRG